MSISYQLGGRFGNNLFQYFACKVIGKYTNKQYIYNTRFDKVFGDLEFKDLYEKCVNNKSCIDGDIYLNGFFQMDFWLIKEKEFLYSLLSGDNEDRINDNYTIKDIVNALNNITIEHLDLITEPSSLVVHIRLDDFYHQGYNSEVISASFLKEYINSVMIDNNINKCIYIVDTLKEPWERDYMDILLSIPNSIMLNNDMLVDFSILFYSTNLMLCRSTFGWIASACSIHNKKVWISSSPNIHSNQHFNTLGDNTIFFNPVYMKDGARNY
jgi:hypothetical protein